MIYMVQFKSRQSSHGLLRRMPQRKSKSFNISATNLITHNLICSSVILRGFSKKYHHFQGVRDCLLWGVPYIYEVHMTVVRRPVDTRGEFRDDDYDRAAYEDSMEVEKT